ncbi:MAG: hypothetical protein ACFFB3_07565 [Candidatus Hodarchaeota archaeon]
MSQDLCTSKTCLFARAVESDPLTLEQKKEQAYFLHNKFNTKSITGNGEESSPALANHDLILSILNFFSQHYQG